MGIGVITDVGGSVRLGSIDRGWSRSGVRWTHSIISNFNFEFGELVGYELGVWVLWFCRNRRGVSVCVLIYVCSDAERGAGM